MTVGVLMLAAGSSRRFGADKRWVQLADGRQMLQASAEVVLRAGLPLCLCLRPGERTPADWLPPGRGRILYCAAAAQGMGATLAQGVAQLPPWRGVLIALADMPWIRPETFRSLAGELHEEALCRPAYRGTEGHPVGFGRAWFASLANLGGDSGARDLIARERAKLRLLPCDDAGVLRDVDRPTDLAG